MLHLSLIKLVAWGAAVAGLTILVAGALLLVFGVFR